MIGEILHSEYTFSQKQVEIYNNHHHASLYKDNITVLSDINMK